MLLLPESPRTATVAEISYTDKSVSIRFPEKHDAFRKIVKAHWYQWNWDKRRWYRAINPDRHGNARDRAIEIAHSLLSADFGVSVPDELQPAIIAGAWEPEITRWIRANQEDFILSWRRPDDLYKAAKRITGARYSPPNVVVPAEQFNEVIDFAERYDFRLSVEAESLIAAQRARLAGAVRVSLSPKATVTPIRSTLKPGKLQVPDDVKIDDSLLDN